MPKVLLPIVAILAMGGSAVLFAACGDSADDGGSPAGPPGTPTEAATLATATPVPAGDTPTPAQTSTPGLETYANDKHGYEVALPTGYRVASLFMDRFAESISGPGRTVSPEDYVLLTSLSEQQEQTAVESASEELAIGLAPWYGFAPGESIHIFPMEVIYPGITTDAFLTDVDTAGIIRTNSDIRGETLDSGESAVRMTRREVDDNGDFTYDLVIVQAEEAFILRIVKTPDYDQDAFETIFRSFSND